MLDTVLQITRNLVSPATQRPTNADRTAPVARFEQRAPQIVGSPILTIDRNSLQSMSVRPESEAKPAA